MLNFGRQRKGCIYPITVTISKEKVLWFGGKSFDPLCTDKHTVLTTK